MGARGPAPKPVELVILEGNPGKRAINNDRPKPKRTPPKCPDWLSPDAKDEWKRVAPELTRLGLLTIVDGSALAGYCQAFARWKQAEQALQDGEGLTFKMGNGYEAQRPEVAIAQKSLLLIKTFCAEFGFTPSARGRMSLPNHDDEEEDDGILD